MERVMVLTTAVLLFILTSSALRNRKAGKGQQEFTITNVFDGNVSN